MRTFLLLLAAAVCYAKNYSTYIGDAFDYRVAALTTDSAGNTFVTGKRNIGLNGFQQLSDVFVTKLDPDGNVLFTSTFGGKAADSAAGIALDLSGNIWVVGSTTSSNFPLLGAIQSKPGLGPTGFVVCLSPWGAVQFSTYLGGVLGNSGLNAIAAAKDGSVYVAGTTNSSDVDPGVSQNSLTITYGAFIARLSVGALLSQRAVVGHAVSCGSGSGCFLSTRRTSASSIAVNATGDVFIAGNTNTTDLPITVGAKGIGAFVMKIGASQGASYLTYIGATQYPVSPDAGPANSAYSIAADAAGNAYLCGATSDPAFPATSSAYQRTWADSGTNNSFYSPTDAFVAKLNPQGSGMVWATYLGGKGTDSAQAIAIGPSGEVWVGGQTGSPDFPGTTGSGTDFLAKLDATGSVLSSAARFPGNTSSLIVALDQSGELHAAGLTGIVWSGDPVTRIYGVGSAAAGLIGGRIAPGEVVSIYSSDLPSGEPVSSAPNEHGLFPRGLNGVDVSFIDNSGMERAAPLLYVSPTQVNAVVPFGLVAPSMVHLRVRSAGGVTDLRVAVDPSIPEIFSNPDGSAAALNQDGSVNSPHNPAKAGSIVTFWATGTGSYFEATDGLVQSGPGLACNCGIVLQDSVTLYAGTAPGTVTGITQFNLKLPEKLSLSQISFSVWVGSKVGEPATLYTAP